MLPAIQRDRDLQGPPAELIRVVDGSKEQRNEMPVKREVLTPAPRGSWKQALGYNIRGSLRPLRTVHFGQA